MKADSCIAFIRWILKSYGSIVEIEGPSVLRTEYFTSFFGQLKRPGFSILRLFLLIVVTQSSPQTHLEIPIILGWLCQSNLSPYGTSTKKTVKLSLLESGRATMEEGGLISSIRSCSSGSRSASACLSSFIFCYDSLNAGDVKSGQRSCSSSRQCSSLLREGQFSSSDRIANSFLLSGINTNGFILVSQLENKFAKNDPSREPYTPNNLNIFAECQIAMASELLSHHVIARRRIYNDNKFIIHARIRRIFLYRFTQQHCIEAIFKVNLRNYNSNQTMSRPKQPRPPASSTRSRPRLSSLADLITHSQHTIASSQATVFSEQSQRTAFTQSYEGFNDLENYQDIIADDGDSLRITPEEEKRIQSILELARKGKINAGNAFEVPVRVVDPQLGEGQNMRFWKFASELLSASMGIYDKRVEHVYLGTNRMFDSLIRVGSNKQQDEQPEEKSRRHRAIILKMDVSQIGGTEALASYDFANINCQESSKLDVKKSVLQFKTDPMFNKRLQAFDSDSLKSLFLNAFEIGSQLQVAFFHDSKQSEQRHQATIQGKLNYQQSTEYSDEQSTKIPCYSLQYPPFIDEEYKKLNLISRTGSLFTDLSHFRKQNHRQGLLQEANLIGDIYEELSFSLRADPTNTVQQQILADEHSYSLSIEKEYTQFTQYSEELPVPTLEEMSTTNSLSERFGPPFFLSAGNSESTVDEMTPWELEFKGLRLQRRKNKRGERRNRREPIQKTEVVDNAIDFLDKVKLSRNFVFKRKNERKIQQDDSRIRDKFALPLNVDPFKRAIEYVPNKKAQQSTFLSQEHNIGNQTSQNVDNHVWNSSQNEEFEDKILQLGERPQSLQALGEGSSKIGKYGAPVMLRNIREVKERLYQRVLEGPMRLSDIEIGLNPSSILVVALHLANEMRIELTPGQLEGDIVLKALR